MPLVSEVFHKNKLKDLNINIETKYIVGNEIKIRNSDDSLNQDVEKGIRCEKNYYVNGELKKSEKEFDSRIEYTYVTSEQDEKEYKCSNCGMKAQIKDFVDGCPYCGTSYNIDYQEKDMGSKYTYDLVLKNSLYRIITGVVDLIVSIIISYIFIVSTSRTFNGYDIGKIFIYGFILALILYYFFYTLDAYIILGPIRRFKERENKEQRDFWERTKVDKATFFNNLNYELGKKYYQDEHIIDYDILDYLEYNDTYRDDILYVEVKAVVRIISYKDGEMLSNTSDESFVLKRHEAGTLDLKDGVNMIRCHNCGSTIDVTKGKCEYCDSEIKYLQEWIMVD